MGFTEYRDAAFLEAIGHPELAGALREFWPSRGPHWDALARLSPASGGSPGALLVEAKSYPEEMAGGGSKAGATSRARIARALSATQEVLGMPVDPERWMGRFYQFANRISYLRWLRGHGVDAWLVHLLLTDDPHGPTSESQWRLAIDEVHAELGLSESHLDHVATVLLPALEPTLLEQSS